MADILARNPKLDDVIRRAANRLGENHGLTNDSHGAVIDNNGNTSRYVGSHGQHPSQLNKPNTNKVNGWHKTLNEMEDMELEEEECLEEGGCGDHAEELREKSPRSRYWNWPWKRKKKRNEEDEMEEATGASSAGSYEGPLFGPMTESDKILKSVIREEVSKKVKTQSLKNRLVEKAFYNTGEFKYEKPTKLPGEIKNVPGMKQTDSSLKKSKSENNKYLKAFDKKIKEYLDFEGNSKPEFPHQNNSKTDYKSPMYRNTSEDEEFIEDFRGMGLEDANGADMLDRMEDYLSGSQKTGNAQTGKDGKALGNVVPDKVGERIKKKVKRKKEKIAKEKSKMTNLRGMTPDVQTVSNLKEHYLLTERKWWQTGLRILGCCTILFPVLFKCCIDTFRTARIANPPTDFPPLDPGLSRDEINSLKPYKNANSWEDLPENVQKILNKAQPRILAYIEEVKNMSGEETRGREIAENVIKEDINKMKHLFSYKDTTQ